MHAPPSFELSQHTQTQTHAQMPPQFQQTQMQNMQSPGLPNSVPVSPAGQRPDDGIFIIIFISIKKKQNTYKHTHTHTRINTHTNKHEHTHTNKHKHK